MKKNKTIAALLLSVLALGSFSSKERTVNALNEGFTEEIAQRLWAKMYPSKPCPGVGRYGERVETVEAILSTFSDDGDVIEDYLVDGRKTVETLKLMVNANGESLSICSSSIS